MIDQQQAGGHTILCIEDEADIRAEIVYELQQSGFTVAEAGCAAEVFEVLQKRTPDLIICDILMPEMNGLELFKKIRADFPQFNATPFIFLSALSDRSHVLEGLKLGADDYLTKPVDFELLETKILLKLDLVARARGENGQAEEISAVHMTPREMQVLQELSRGHKNAEIASHLGLSEFTVGDYIKVIYKKLNVTSRTQAVHEAVKQRLLRLMP